MDKSTLDEFNKLPLDNATLKIDDTSENLTVASVSGLLDTYNSPHFTRKCNFLIDSGVSKLVLDLSSTTYVSSTGIGAFVDLLKRVKPRGGNVVLVNVQPKVHEVFQLLGFTSFFSFEDSVKKAKALFIGETEEVKSLFPKTFRCRCGKRLKTSKPGRFRCPQCSSIITVLDTGKASIAK